MCGCCNKYFFSTRSRPRYVHSCFQFIRPLLIYIFVVVSIRPLFGENAAQSATRWPACTYWSTDTAIILALVCFVFRQFSRARLR